MPDLMESKPDTLSFTRNPTGMRQTKWHPTPGERRTVARAASNERSVLDDRTFTVHGRPRHVASRQVIINKGAPATHLFIVVSGRVKVSASSEDGKEITFAILGPGEVVGELALLAGSEHSATVTALEPTELLVFERRDFLALLQGQPDFAVDLLTTVCTRLRCSTEMTEDLSFLPLPVRLAKKLVTLARAYGTSTSRGMRIGLHLCQQELANLVSTTRESVNKQLALWQAEGLVATEKGFLVIRDLPTFVSRFRL